MGTMLFDGARHIAAQSKIDAARITTKSGNQKRAALSSLDAFNQSLSNKHAMEAAGDAANVAEMNLARNLDAATYGKLGSRVAAAEQLGASVTEAAAAGVGGSSVEAYNQTLELSQAMGEEQADRATSSAVYDAGQYRAGVMGDALAGLRRDVIAPNLDFTQYVDDHKQSTLTKIVGTAATAAATYFGGPSAGMAVQNLMTADQQAGNGDFAGASRSMTSAVQNGYGGVRMFTSGADGEHPSGRAWGARIFGRSRPAATGESEVSAMSGYHPYRLS